MKIMFERRTLFIATKHKKEEVIQPIFESNFAMKCVVPENFDSDVLGTFSGEIERSLSPIAAAREKCLSVAKKYNCDLVIANEGSFFPDPITGFLPLNEEVVMLTDLKNGLEIKIVERSMKTNFRSEEVTNVNDLLKFATAVSFPSHGVILKAKLKGKNKFVKGIVNYNYLINCFQSMKKRTDSMIVETDMRAMFNPTRMKVIKQAALKLSTKIKTCCPNCSTPGFGAESAVPGLKCSHCSMPTKSIKAYIFSCQKCRYQEEVGLPNRKRAEDPMYCDFCNP